MKKKQIIFKIKTTVPVKVFILADFVCQIFAHRVGTSSFRFHLEVNKGDLSSLSPRLHISLLSMTHLSTLRVNFMKWNIVSDTNDMQ